MPIFQVPGVGSVRLPDDLKEEEYERVIRKLVENAPPQERIPSDYSAGQIFGGGLERSGKQLAALGMYDVPALGLAALAKLGFGGAEDKALEFLQKGKERYAQIEQETPTLYGDVTKLKGPGEYVGFGLEKLGESIPSLASAIVPGGIASIASRGAAKIAAEKAMASALARGLPLELAEREAVKASRNLLMGRVGATTGVASYAQTAPDAFRTIFEESGQLDPGLAAAAGAVNSLLESYVPAKLLGNLGAFGRIKLVEKSLERGGFKKEAAKIAGKTALVAAQEGLTEAAQEIVNNTAVKILDENYEVFSPQNINKYVNALAAGMVGGAVPGAIGALADRTRPELARPETTVPPVTPPPQEAQQTPPVQPPVQPSIQPAAQPAAQPVAQPAVPQVQPTAQLPQVPPVQAAQPPAQLPSVAAPQQQMAPPQPVQQPVPPVQQPLPPPAQQPTPPPVQQPVPPPVQQLTPPPVQQLTPPPVQQLAPPSPAEQPPLINLSEKPPEGPPEFVEPPPEQGPQPYSEDEQAARDYEAELLKRREQLEKGKGSLWNALKGRISFQDIKDSSPDKALRLLIGKPTSKDFKGLDLLVADGELDAWLPPNLQSFALQKDSSLEIPAVNWIKDRIARRDFLTDSTKEELAIIEERLDELIPLIREYEDELEANLQLAEAGDQQRAEQAEQAAVPREMEQAVTKSPEGVVEPSQAPTKPPITVPPVTQQATPKPTVPPVTSAPAVSKAPAVPPDATQEERDMFDTLRAEMDSLGLTDLSLELVRPKRKSRGAYTVGSMTTSFMRDPVDPTKKLAVARLMRVSIDLRKRTKSPSSQNPAEIRRTLHHEIIHALRSMNLFTADEWRILSEASQRDWVNRVWPGDAQSVAKIYSKEPRDIKIEEGVARAFENYTLGEFQPKGAIARIFQKTKEFFKKLADYATGLGIKEDEAEVFERILSGEIGSRVRKDQTLYRVPYDKIESLSHSDEFNKWFGDSKVVNENGDPLVMYHGTKKSDQGKAFTYFNVYNANYGLFGYGGYFTDDPRIASEYAGKGKGETPTVYPVFLSIKNPLDMDAVADPKQWTNLNESLDDYHEGGNTNESWYRALETYYRDNNYSKEEGASAIQEDLISMGYDGVTHIGGGRVDKQGARHRVYIAFDPEQIKSVFNKGTWNPESNDILEKIEQTEQIIYDVEMLNVKPEESIDNLVKSGPEFKDIKDGAKNYIKDKAADKANVILSAFNLRQLGELADKALPQIKMFYRTVNDMLAFRDTRITKAADIAKGWVAFRDKHPKIAEILADVMHGATILGLDPDKNLEEIKQGTAQARLFTDAPDAYKDLANNWEKIADNPEALKIYREVRDYYAESLDLYQKALEQRIKESIEDDRQKTAALLKIEQEFNNIRSTGPYFPLARFGDYWVSFKAINDEGKQMPEYYMFENRAEQRQFEDQLRKDGVSFKSGVKSRQMLGAGVPMTGFMREMMGLVDGMDGDKEMLKDNLWQLFLTMQPDLSARKHFIHRKKVAGYSTDALRAFAETSFHGAYHLARVKYNGRLESIVLEADKHRGDNPSIEADRYFDELLLRQKWVNAPEDVNSFTSWATSFSFMYFLTAPASALVNLAQTPMIAFPYLGGKFGYTRAFSELSTASKQFFASGISKDKGFYDVIRTLKERAEAKNISDKERQLRQEELAAMQQLYEDGTLNRTQTLSLAGLAERPSDILQGGLAAVMKSKAFKTTEKITYALGYTFNQAEVFNRQITALAAYRLARKKGAATDAALQTAKDIVNETHFEYTNATKPRFMQGPTARIIFQFKNYAQQMTVLLAKTLKQAVSDADEEVQREARARLTGILFMTGLFAGYEGLPLFWVFEAVMNAMFDEEDEPYDFVNSAKNNIADMFGSNAARMLSKGVVSEIIGGDIANRVSMNGMWFRDSNKSADEVEAFKQFVIDLTGPFVGIGVNMADGIKKINDGHPWRGTEAMLPPVLKDFLKVARFSTEGATTLRGDPIVGEISTWGLFMQALGFTPTDLARGYEAMGEIKGLENDIERYRKRLLQRSVLAEMNGDVDEMVELAEKRARYNEKNPENPITNETMKRSKSQRVKDSERALRGIIVNPKREYLLEETRYLGEED